MCCCFYPHQKQARRPGDLDNEYQDKKLPRCSPLVVVCIRHAYELARKELVHLIGVYGAHVERVEGAFPVEATGNCCVVAQLVFSPIDHHGIFAQCI